jgi:MtfA peptidase
VRASARPHIVRMGLTTWLQRLIGEPTRLSLPEATWQRALRRPAWTSALDAATKARLREFTERFLADKAISAAGGMELDDDQRVLIAMLCCRPVLYLDYGWLQGWHEVIVYPRPFRRPAQEYDGRAGVVSEWDSHASGESWWRGPMVLSWADVSASVDAPRSGYDVVVHEIAHKLDGLHDGVDGAPRLHVNEVTGWARDFQAAFDELCADLNAGREPPIDAHAGEAPAEFFAVCSEYWFTAPGLLHAAYPAVAARLAAFYGNPQANDSPA